ncbi:MAG: hypothetical protein R3A47_05745 [Polyangiales bacterium]
MPGSTVCADANTLNTCNVTGDGYDATSCACIIVSDVATCD